MYCNATTTRLLVGRLTPAIRATFSAPVAGVAGRFLRSRYGENAKCRDDTRPLGPDRHRRRANAKRMPGIKGFQVVPSTTSDDRINTVVHRRRPLRRAAFLTGLRGLFFADFLTVFPALAAALTRVLADLVLAAAA